MAGTVHKNYFLVAIILSLLNVYQFTSICKGKNPCLCQLTDTTALDISNISSPLTPLNSIFGNFTYLYSPCHNIDFKYKNCENATLCVFGKPDNGSVTGKSLGKAEDFNFIQTNGIYQLTFKSESEDTTINLMCQPNTPKSVLLVQNKDEKKNALFLLSPQACVVHHEHHHNSLSTGSVLLIIFSVGFAVYMIGGALVLYTLRGARGYEMVPNIDFWKGLPSLVRDGFLYLMNGCTLPSTVTSTAETYDRI